MGVPESQKALYVSLERAQRRLEQARDQGNQDLIAAYSAHVHDIREQIGRAARQSPVRQKARKA